MRNVGCKIVPVTSWKWKEKLFLWYTFTISESKEGISDQFLWYSSWWVMLHLLQGRNMSPSSIYNLFYEICTLCGILYIGCAKWSAEDTIYSIVFTPPISGIYLSKTYPFPYCDLLDVANQIKWSMNSRIIVKWQGKYEWYSKVYLMFCDQKYERNLRLGSIR